VQTNEIWVSDEVDGSVLLLAPLAAAFLRTLVSTRAQE